MITEPKHTPRYITTTVDGVRYLYVESPNEITDMEIQGAVYTIETLTGLVGELVEALEASVNILVAVGVDNPWIDTVDSVLTKAKALQPNKGQ
jgi:hypothetical protein